MKKKIKVVFVWSKKNYFLSGDYTDNNIYYFFMKRLKQNALLDITFVETEEEIDCLQFKGYDALLFYSPHKKFTPRLKNLKRLNISKFAMSGDSHNYRLMLEELKEYGTGINYFFTNSLEYFYRYFPETYKYKQIILGVEPHSGYANVVPLKERKDSKILNTGLLLPVHHVLRKECNTLDCVEYVPKKEYVGNRFSKLLMMYKAAISAVTQCFTFRHLEVSLAGCIPFLEITKENSGKNLGFTDGDNAIFISSDNYRDRILEYFKTKDDTKWETLTIKAREFVLDNYTTAHGVNRLAEYIKENI